MNKSSKSYVDGIYRSIVNRNYLEDRREYCVEDLRKAYGLNKEDGEYLEKLIQANFTPTPPKPLQRFLVVYCTYNPNSYQGHRIKRFEAETMEDAEKRTHEWLEGMAGKGDWEYQITQISDDTPYRIYNNATHKRA